MRDHKVRKDQYQKRTHAPTFIHAYGSHKRLSPSNESNMVAGEPAVFRLTMTRSRVPERSRPFYVEFACFRRCPPAVFLLAVQRLIGDSEFPHTVGESCVCVCTLWWKANMASTRIIQEMEDGRLHPGTLSEWTDFFFLFRFVFRILFCFSWVSLL